jgi:hypothetical protein
MARTIFIGGSFGDVETVSSNVLCQAAVGIHALPKASFGRWQGKCPFQARDSTFVVQPWTEKGI